MSFHLLVQKSPPATALEEYFSLGSILLFQVSFIINEFPRSATLGAPRFTVLMLHESTTQIATHADVESGIRLRFDDVNIKHDVFLSSNVRSRSSYVTQSCWDTANLPNPQSREGGALLRDRLIRIYRVISGNAWHSKLPHSGPADMRTRAEKFLVESRN